MSSWLNTLHVISSDGDDDDVVPAEAPPPSPPTRIGVRGSVIPFREPPSAKRPRSIRPLSLERPAAVSLKWRPFPRRAAVEAAAVDVSGLALRPRSTQVLARLTGSGSWGDAFCFELRALSTPFLIGRADPFVDLDCRPYTVARTVSHRQCSIKYKPRLACFELRSLGLNGTLVNGWRVQGRQALRDGDEITFGGMRITYSLVQGDAV